MTETIRPRRSLLFMPGSNRRMLDKARSLPVDGVIMDLEDAVAPDAKTDARASVVREIAAGGYGRRELIVRINPYGSEWFMEDLRAAVTSGADALLVPKVDSADQVSKFGDLMAINGAPDAMRLWIMAETPLSILNIDTIARSEPRLAVIVMGTNDLAKALRLPPDPDRTGLRAALSACVLAARARGLDILDGVHGDLADADGFARSCDRGRKLGFDGKTLIHPRQIEAANAVFGVSDGEVASARRIIDAWDAAAAQGQGIAVVDGQMIEALHADEARRVLALSTAIIEQNKTDKDKN